MFNVKQPFYAEGEGGGYFPPSWGDVLRGASSEVQPETDTEDTSADEVQDEQDVEIDETDDSSDADEQDADETVEDEDYDVDMGDGKQAIKLSELKNGYQRQSDYTKKTQEIATQRKELETQREGLTNAIGFQEHMEANPWLWEQVSGAIQQFNDTGILPIEEALQDAQYGKYINNLMSENNRLKKELEGASGERDGLKLTSTMSKLERDLKADYGDLVTDEYMEKLSDRAKTDKLSEETLREIADGYLAKQSLANTKANTKDVKKQTQAQTVQRLAETRAPKPTKTTTARPASPVATTDGSWSGLFRSLTK